MGEVDECLQIKLNRSWNFYFQRMEKVFYYGYLKNFEKRKRSVIDIALFLLKISYIVHRGIIIKIF